MARKKKSAKARPKAKKKAAKKSAKRKPAGMTPPKGYHPLIPYLCFKDSAFAIQFYANAFGAKETMRLTDAGGKIGHAEMKVANDFFMLSDEHPDAGALSAETMGGCPIKLHLVVKDVDAFVKKALAAGATEVRPIVNQFYGMRSGTISDPFGYSWLISTPIEHVTAKEMQKRLNKLTAPAN